MHNMEAEIMIMTKAEADAKADLINYFSRNSALQSKYANADDYAEQIMKKAWEETVREIDTEAKQGKKHDAKDVEAKFRQKAEEQKVLFDPANFHSAN